MLVVLALIACTSNSGTGTGATTEPAPTPVLETPPPAGKIPAILLVDAEPAAMPVGEVITQDCFRAPTRSTPKPSPTTTTRARPGSAPTMAVKAPSAKPTRSKEASSPMDDLAFAPSAAPSMDAPDPAPTAPMATTAPMSGASGTVTGGSAVSGPMEVATRSESAAVAAEPAPAPKADLSDAKTADRDRDGAGAGEIATAKVVEKKKPTSSFDWGGTTWLSNDDSMSLASAQHLLHAVKNDNTVKAADIRPHELLNYFSFDTTVPGDGQLFSVTPSAEKTADSTVTVALAVKGATPPRRPLDVTFVVDRSGSMSAEGRMEYVKRALLLGVDQLATGDRVDIVLFDDSVCTPIRDFVVGRDDAKLLKTTIGKLAPEGGTNIGIGLKEAYKIVDDPARDAGIHRNRRVMLMTDALTNQGEIDADALAKVASGYDKAGVRLTGVGVGVGFNDHILDTVTEKGHGAYVYLGSESVVDRLFGPGFRSMTETIAHDVQFELDLPPTLAMERFYGEESSTDKADIEPIHYYANTTQLFLQDLKVDPSKLAPSDPITLTIHYRDAFTDEPGEQKFTWTVGDLMKADRHNLDKARALMGWTDLLLADAMGGEACSAPLTTWSQRAAKVSDDMEISYVHGLVGKTCRGVMPLPEAPASGLVAGVAYKVRVDSDVPIAEVELACGPKNLKETLSSGDTIARFDAPPGMCTVTLQGNVPMTAKVDVPESGGDVKCMVRGGRMSCG
jgi:Ca-activated chloride channel homolog